MARIAKLSGVLSIAALTVTLGALVASAQPREGREQPARRGPPDMERLLGGEGGRDLLRENLVRRLGELDEQRTKIKQAIEAIDAGEEPVGVARKLMGGARDRAAERRERSRVGPNRDARDATRPELEDAPPPPTPTETEFSDNASSPETEQSASPAPNDAVAARMNQMVEVRQRAVRLDEAIRIQSAVLRRIERNPQANPEVIDRRRTDLRGLLEQRFELEAQIAESRITSMELRLDAVKQGLERRLAEREQLIDNRLNGLLRPEPPVSPQD